MSVTDRAAATAARLIGRLGTAVTITRDDPEAYDELLDREVPGEQTATSTACEITASEADQFVPGSLLAQSERAVIVAGAPLAFEPKAGDRIAYGAQALTILQAVGIGRVDGRALAPAYVLGCRT